MVRLSKKVETFIYYLLVNKYMNDNYFQLNEKDEDEIAASKKRRKENLKKIYGGIKSTLKNKSNVALIGGAIGAHTAGSILGFYSDMPQYDSITHFLSSVALARSSETFLNETGHEKLKKYIPLTILSLGVVWEIYEYLAGVQYSLGDSSMGFLAAVKNTFKDLGNDIFGAETGTSGSLLNRTYEKSVNTLAKIDTIKYNILGF